MHSEILCYVCSDGDSIKVFLRVRPPDSETDHSINVLTVDKENNAVVLQSKPEPKVFTYDSVADIEATQVSTALL